jgi:hypothetical protein
MQSRCRHADGHRCRGTEVQRRCRSAEMIVIEVQMQGRRADVQRSSRC